MKSKQLLAIALLLFASDEQQQNAVNAVKLEEGNLAVSQHRISLRQKSKHRTAQKQKSNTNSNSNDEQQDATTTLSSVEIADVQTENQEQSDSNIKAEDGDAEQKRQEKAKFDEVQSLMNKYDQAEAHIKWVNSPEYAQQKEQAALDAVKKKEEEKKQAKEMEELQKQREEEEEKEKKQTLIQQEEDVRHNEEYVKKACSKYLQAFSTEDGRRVLTKDKAYIAAGDVVAKVRKIRGVDQQKFLDNYFQGVWESHDERHNNLIEQSDVEEFFNDILSAGGETKQPDDDQ